MYAYDRYDQTLVEERVAQFRDQTQRRMAGELTEDEFRPLRLQNGLYLQLHAYMLRVAIPYGALSSRQLRTLAHVARKYDRGYGHFSTRQNIQFNWVALEQVPDLLGELAQVQMHAIQTSGNCIRNVTADPLAGIAPDEFADPRAYCEIIRQWSTFHPEFAFLPRKFKIAVTGAKHDRAAVEVHDIGLRLRLEQGEPGFEVWVGGGLGRTPRIGQVVRDFVPQRDLLAYLEAILRVYNRFGRRDNKYKARIKILVGSLGIERFAELVEEEWKLIADTGLELTQAEYERVAAFFAPPDYEVLPDAQAWLDRAALTGSRQLSAWLRANVLPHRQPGYSAVVVSLKPHGRPPGDITHQQMDAVADLADAHSFGRIVATYGQNLVLPHVPTLRLADLHAELQKVGLGEGNVGRLTDIICCPGLDYCNLASTRSIPVSEAISRHFDDYDYLHDLGDVSLKMSGCVNACGHHHVGNIGILGVDRAGEEYYQVTLGGSAEDGASIGKIVGRAFSRDEIVGAIDAIMRVYLEGRDSSEERFLDFVRRVGLDPFKTRLYAD
ncbi:MAG: nitrite/sulfite reductase [Myxococcales bacterium FL481]|nr:MAG: nitrite/sulfite reductase [Myxococcales bacterium FL481]